MIAHCSGTTLGEYVPWPGHPLMYAVPYLQYWISVDQTQVRTWQRLWTFGSAPTNARHESYTAKGPKRTSPNDFFPV
jgi:hypothetical protein